MFKVALGSTSKVLDLLSTFAPSKEGCTPLAVVDLVDNWLESDGLTITVSQGSAMEGDALNLEVDGKNYRLPCDTHHKTSLAKLTAFGKILVTVDITTVTSLVVTCLPHQETLARELFK